MVKPDIFTHASPMESPGFRFWQTFIKWQRQIDIILAPLDLTQPSFSILAIIGWQLQQNISISNKYVRQKVIVDMSGMPKMQVSLILQRLKKSKLISISPYPLDLREQQVELTQAGLIALSKAIVLVEEVDKKILSKKDSFKIFDLDS
ncbi:MAG: MarR family transcriptional regulator [Acinetobacter calcoaceticus]